MANAKGSGGSVYEGTNAIAELKSWSLSTSANTIDDSELSDAWATKQVGQKTWNGSAEAFWDKADTAQTAIIEGAELTMHFAPEGNTTGDADLTGAVIVTAVERSAGIDGMVEVSFTFEGNGALTVGSYA